MGMALEHLYERIKDARERSGMTASEAEDALGVSRIQIWRLENKSKTISAERLFELADLYGVEPRQLLQGDEAPAMFNDLYRRIGDVVLMVEGQVQTLNVRPSPEIIKDAIIEILQQEASQPIDAKSQPFDPSRYKGLITLLFEQASKL